MQQNDRPDSPTARIEAVEGGAERVVFTASVAGATTSGSHYPRMELREDRAGGDWSCFQVPSN